MTEAASVRYATFVVQDLFFGIDVLRVQEVLRYHEMTSVPLAPDVVCGLINLRGQIVTALDMRCRLNLAPRPAGILPMNIVVRTEDGPVSLLVDDIGDVLQPGAPAWESTPENVSPDVRELIGGVYKLNERLLLVLDTDKALDVRIQDGDERSLQC